MTPVTAALMTALMAAISPAGVALAQTVRQAAQAASGVVGAVPADKPAADAASAREAMERAQRQANNPMRIILEAGRIRRKAGEADAVDSADAAGARRPGVAPPATASAGATAQPTAPGATAGPLPTEAGAATAVPATATPAMRTLRSDVAQGRPAGPSVPDLQREDSGGPLADVASPVPVLPEAAPAAPRLLSMVEPAVHAHQRQELARLGTVLADLSLRPDGSVADVQLVSAVPRALQRALDAALRDWRFAPLPAARRHRVELVFRAED